VRLYFFLQQVDQDHLEDERRIQEAREVGIGHEKIGDATQAYPSTPLCQPFAIEI
jgi:hypothetical protein